MQEGAPAKARAELQRAWDAGLHTEEVARFAAEAAAKDGDAASAFAWVERGVPEETLARLRELVDQPMTEGEFYKVLSRAGGGAHGGCGRPRLGGALAGPDLRAAGA